MDAKMSMRRIQTPKNSEHKYRCHSTQKEAVDTRKKKIGPYSFYQQDCIGSGSCGQVYKCIKDKDKEQVYAIKVIKLNKLSKATHKLLQNQINILRQLNHPNILRLHDVFYTTNHCYLVTDFCEGGTLQQYIDRIHSVRPNPKEFKFQWEDIIRQLIQGSKYLSQELIVHRDIKPANIFLKGSLWKIGDFGFARTIDTKETQVREGYTIGSPLYMPLQTIKNNIYSLKTDSFALGVLIFYLITYSYPWNSQNKKELIKNYETKPYPSYRLDQAPENLKTFLIGLSEIDINKRLYVEDYDQICGDMLKSQHTSVSGSPDEEFNLRQYVSQMKLYLSDQLKVCLFLHYMDHNIHHLPQMHQLCQYLQKSLKFFTSVFMWTEKPSLQKYVQEFNCLDQQELTYQQTKQLLSIMQKLIDQLSGTVVKTCQVLQVKMIQYCKVLKKLLVRDEEGFRQEVKDLVLHPQFSTVHFYEEEKTNIRRSRIQSYL